MTHAYRPVSCQTCRLAVAAYVSKDSDDPALLCFKCYLDAERDRLSADTSRILDREAGFDAMLDELEDDLPW